MPRARREPIEEFLLDVEEKGYELPDGLEPAAAYRLAAAASFFARRSKALTLRPDHLVVRDALLSVEVPVRPATSAADLPSLLADEAPAARARSDRTVLWLDATEAKDPDYAFEHAMWGTVTLFQYPTKPRRPTDERILDAERRGWGSVLKTFNLLPARGIVVEDGKTGHLVCLPDAGAFAGFVLHGATGEMTWWPNPFVEPRFGDPDFQFWLVWGEGSRATEWRTLVEKTEE